MAPRHIPRDRFNPFSSYTGAGDNNNGTNLFDDGIHHVTRQTLVIAAVSITALALIILFACCYMQIRGKRIPTANDARQSGEDPRTQAAQSEASKQAFDSAVPLQSLAEWKNTHSSDSSPQDSPRAWDYTCVICLDDIEDDAQIRSLNCNHIYHMSCLDTWFLKGHNECPLCKEHFAEDQNSIKEVPPEPPSASPG